MKVVVVYKEHSDHARAVIDWLRDFEKQTSKKLEVVDPDSAAGADFCSVYDIVEYPTFVAITDQGILQTTWRGIHLPTISEVSYYVS